MFNEGNKVYILKHKIPNIQITLVVGNDEYHGRKRYALEFRNKLTEKRLRTEITKVLETLK